MIRKLFFVLSVASMLLPRVLVAGQEVLHLPLGDPDRRDNEVPLVRDGITDTASGELITPRRLALGLADTGILLVGESHTNMDDHRIQLRIIQELHDAGREVLIGLEMFPYTEQESLDSWRRGLFTEEGFVELAEWYEHWGYHWGYYRDIFLFAQEKGIRMYAINTPRPVVRAIRTKGFEGLSEEEAAALPPQGVVPATDEQRQMYRAFFDEDDSLHRAITGGQLEGMLRAQTTWDATMGWNALRALKENDHPGSIMVVLIGSGHVTYGLGSERQIAPHFHGKISSVIPVPVVDDDGEPVASVRASYASFVWGVGKESDPLFPTLGISLMGAHGPDPMQLIQVSEDSVGDRFGLEVGDVLLSMDGEPLDSRAALRKKTAGYRWGDEVLLRIRRDGQEMDLRVPFRRAGP